MNQLHFDTSEILRTQGVNNVVLCPGSRNAPLIISFGQNKRIHIFSFVDERSAAYAAMGLSIEKLEPVAVCCTSGTALLNCYPAVSEAFYLQIPLVVISADRPPSWVDQQDGQTIRQSGAMRNHVKQSFDLPVDLDHPDAQWEYKRKLQEAVSIANSYPKGPVHINIPLREPFYPEENQELKFSEFNRFQPSSIASVSTFSEEFLESWSSKEKILALVGQNQLEDQPIAQIVKELVKKNVPVLAEVTSNISPQSGVVNNTDLVLMSDRNIDDLKPELILTMGQTIVSKGLKQFVKASKCDHWHIDTKDSRLADTFKSLKGTISSAITSLPERPAAEYLANWMEVSNNTRNNTDPFWLKAPFSDLSAYKTVLSNLPDGANLHLANSMAVRYAGIIGVSNAKKIFSNRGTSGIDGSNSTAVGIALGSSQRNILITGDLSLFYDRNAFLHNHDLGDFKIVVFNNFEGGIFDLIKGPQAMDDSVKDVFVKTQHQRNFQYFAEEFDFKYYVADNQRKLEDQLASFWDYKEKALLEVQTQSDANNKAFKSLKNYISN